MIKAEKFTAGQPRVRRIGIGRGAMLNACETFLAIQQQQAFEEKLLQPPAQRDRLLPHGEAEAVGRFGQDRTPIKRLDLAANPILKNPVA